MENTTCYRRNRGSTPWDVDTGGCERTEIREAVVMCGLAILCYLLAVGCGADPSVGQSPEHRSVSMTSRVDASLWWLLNHVRYAALLYS